TLRSCLTFRLYHLTSTVTIYHPLSIAFRVVSRCRDQQQQHWVPKQIPPGRIQRVPHLALST
ncbi:hypothetical protein JMJ77_0007967, partial [Colletotrichum scovillei]